MTSLCLQLVAIHLVLSHPLQTIFPFNAYAIKAQNKLCTCCVYQACQVVRSFGCQPTLHTAFGISLLKFWQPTSLVAKTTRRTTYGITMGVLRLSRRLIEVSVLLGSGAVPLGVGCPTYRGKNSGPIFKESNF